MSRRRMRSSSQLSAGNGPFETSTVSGIAKCSSRPIFPSMTVLWTTVGMRSLSLIYRRLAKLGIKIDDSCVPSYAVQEGRPGQEQTTRVDRATQNAQSLAIAICEE